MLPSPEASSPEHSPKQTLKSHPQSPPKEGASTKLKKIDVGAIHTMAASGGVLCPSDQWSDLMEYVQ